MYQIPTNFPFEDMMFTQFFHFDRSYVLPLSYTVLLQLK